MIEEVKYNHEDKGLIEEKRYRVYFKGTRSRNGKNQILLYYEGNYYFSAPFLGNDSFTKQELVDAGFGDVFDNPMFEVREVE